ncbi:MAG TPA: imidazole glycerol phosphate synthase subunit HisH [Alphaproteobacteria bacterium]
MKVAIVDYGSGNLRSAAKAFERAGAEAGLELRIAVTEDAAEVAGADRIVLPGVGAFGDCAHGLARLPGMHDALTRAVIEQARPFLGVCVGMQLLAEQGFEHGRHDGLGWIPGAVVALTPRDASLKIPHMGWNELAIARAHPLLDGVGDGAHCYFVHGYQFAVADHADLIACTDHGGPVTAVIGRDNIVGTQFHPEKSQKVGLKVIGNFLRWRP